MTTNKSYSNTEASSVYSDHIPATEEFYHDKAALQNCITFTSLSEEDQRAYLSLLAEAREWSRDERYAYKSYKGGKYDW